jgi:FOG: CBS domain
MNILFFLTPKDAVEFIYEDFTLRQTIEKMEHHKYTAIPLLSKEGNYIGTITEGDILRLIKDKYSLNLQEAQSFPIKQVPRRWHNSPVDINCNVEDLFLTAMGQNFIPVVDDKDKFIGIVTRKDILEYSFRNFRKNEKEKDN